jgi:hypothetical protein
MEPHMIDRTETALVKRESRIPYILGEYLAKCTKLIVGMNESPVKKQPMMKTGFMSEAPMSEIKLQYQYLSSQAESYDISNQ